MDRGLETPHPISLDTYLEATAIAEWALRNGGVTADRQNANVRRSKRDLQDSGTRWVRLSAPVILLFGLGVLMWMLAVSDSSDVSIGLMLFGAACVVVGYTILVRADGNRVGLALSLIAISVIVSSTSSLLIEDTPPNLDVGLIIAIGGTAWFGMFLSVSFLLYWFPTGRAPSPRWRWVGWFGGLATGTTLMYLFAEQTCLSSDSTGCIEWVRNPLGIPGVPDLQFGLFWGPVVGIFASFALLSIMSLVVRFLRSRGLERLQIKWVALSAVLIILGLVIPDVITLPGWIGDELSALSFLTLPLSIAASVLKYRLYDIDRVVSRTVTYTLVVGVLGLVFFGLVTFLSSRLGSGHQLVVAGSTLAVAALFNPLRHRVQRQVDRRFNRSKYDTQRVIDQFTETLRGGPPAEAVVAGWIDVVSGTMQPSTINVWIRN